MSKEIINITQKVARARRKVKQCTGLREVSRMEKAILDSFAPGSLLNREYLS